MLFGQFLQLDSDDFGQLHLLSCFRLPGASAEGGGHRWQLQKLKNFTCVVLDCKTQNVIRAAGVRCRTAALHSLTEEWAVDCIETESVHVQV